MSYEKIYNKWTEFINHEKYKKYFQPNEEKMMIIELQHIELVVNKKIHK